MIFPATITKRQCTETAIVFALTAIVLGMSGKIRYALFIAGALLLLVLLLPSLFRFPAYLWFGLANAAGWVVSRVLLTVIFCVFVAPMGIIRRFAGKDSLKVRYFKKGKESAFIERKHKYSAPDLKYPF
jgi:hypothetical protein